MAAGEISLSCTVTFDEIVLVQGSVNGYASLGVDGGSLDSEGTSAGVREGSDAQEVTGTPDGGQTGTVT